MINTEVLSTVSDPGGVIPEVVQSVEDNRKHDVARLEQQADAHGLDYMTTVAEGVPEKVIDEYADEYGVDLITMGTHGRSGIDRFLLGSVTERTIRESDTPVLTTPAED